MKTLAESFNKTTNASLKLELRYVEEFGVLACYIPWIDLVFNANDFDAAIDKAIVMTKFWINFHKDENGKPTVDSSLLSKATNDAFTSSMEVEFNFDLRYIGEEGGFSFYIPMTQQYFSADSIEEGRRRAVVMVRAFIDFWRTRNFVN